MIAPSRGATGRVWAYLALACVGMAGSACSRTEPSRECPGVQGGEAIDQSTMAFLSIARASHHQADLDEARGDTRGAITVLARLVTTPAPKATEVREVLADARARLAELRMKEGDIEGAEKDVHEGLREAQEPTYFRGHLLEVQGLLEEARSTSLMDAGKAAEANRAREKAMSLLEEAVRIQQRVLERALGDGGRDD